MKKFLLLMLALAQFIPSDLSAQTESLHPKATDPDFLNDLEERFNEDLGREAGSDDYVHFFGNGRNPGDIPPGSRAMGVYFSNRAPRDGTVGEANDRDGETFIYYDEVFEITSDPFGPIPSPPPFWPDHIPAFSIILIHEAQHLPTDGGSPMPDFPEGLRGPGMPTYVPGGGEEDGLEMTCEHLKLHVDTYKEACDILATMMASHDPGSIDTDLCDEISALCMLNKAAERKLNSDPINADPYISLCDGLTPWANGWVVPCAECEDFMMASCSPGYGDPPIIVGETEPHTFNHMNPYAPTEQQ